MVEGVKATGLEMTMSLNSATLERGNLNNQIESQDSLNLEMRDVFDQNGWKVK